jgi:hypothetical protein
LPRTGNRPEAAGKKVNAHRVFLAQLAGRTMARRNKAGALTAVTRVHSLSLTASLQAVDDLFINCRQKETHALFSGYPVWVQYDPIMICVTVCSLIGHVGLHLLGEAAHQRSKLLTSTGDQHLFDRAATDSGIF